MIFDKLAGVVERHLPEYKDIVEQSRLFVFEGKAKELLPKKINSGQLERMDTFTLPFPITAVEDLASLIILVDQKEGQLGLDKPRMFIEAMPFNILGREDQFIEDEDQVRETEAELRKNTPADSLKKMNDSLQVTVGIMRDVAFTTRPGTKDQGITTGPVKVERFVTVSKKYGILYDSDNEPAAEKEIMSPEFINNAAINAFVALEEIVFFSSPDHFTLKTAPAKESRKAKKGKKILRSEQRPIYTMLKPREIRDRLGLSNPEISQTSGRRPHERRAHYRQLRIESGFKENKIIPVKSSWVGPCEAQRGNRRYKVMLDLFY